MTAYWCPSCRRFAAPTTTREQHDATLAHGAAARTPAMIGTRLESRPTVGSLIVPYIVDESRDPIDFKELDHARVAACAERGLCGICGGKIRRGPIAFAGPDDGRRCFADPWMHPHCADVAMASCPFLSGRHDWRDPDARVDPLTARYSAGMVTVLAFSWRSHRDEFGQWHFEAIGELRRP